ncbi:hypothetical protein BDP27DRAFT_1163304, partial [Rhodocollybia butyracea]
WPLTPQGNWALDLSHSVVAETSNLAVDWACHASSGKQRAGSSKDSSMLDLGHRSYRQCLGTIHCGNPDCAVTIRPHTHGPSAIQKQLSKECKCGNQNLTHHSCPNKSAIVRWSGGFVHTNPKASPAALISGNTVDGKSATEISSVLIHAPRVSRMRKSVLSKGTMKGGTGDAFVETFSNFQLEHPGFIVANTMLGGVTVISGQTPFMASQIHDEALQIDGPFNGIVTDAAHGWWQVRSSLLIISSVFSQILLRWVPVLISYSNGATSTHYEQHFLALLESIARVCTERNKPITDELFTGVCFIFINEPKRSGFIGSFVGFWLKQSNPRTAEELQRKGATLLRGCRQHFEASITRVKCITAIV